MTRILVIEDEVILREEIIEWLTLEGYEPFSAANGIEGVKTAFQHQPDVIICDITMPCLNGHGVLLELRSNPKTADIPFIFITARAAHDDVREGMRLGADDYITKPFTHRELLDAIEARLQKKLLLKQLHQQEVDQWQQALEQEREQRLFKAKLVGMFSHDFRTQLAVIKATNDLICNYGDHLEATRRQSHFERIGASVQQLLDMLDDMLLVAQMESGCLDFQPEPLDVGTFIQTIVDEFQAIHWETHQIHFENHAYRTVMVDQRLLRQICANLISNAIKYSPQSNEVDVRLTVSEDQFQLCVQDQGIGIPEAEQRQLFDVFERGSNVGDIAGTGLGLAIIKQSVDVHRGSIYCESVVGQGTTFVVEFPVDAC